MYTELIELFRCPVPHAESWLVAAIDRAEDRVILQGTLGCPTCGAQYAISGGILDMSAGRPQQVQGGEGSPDAWRTAALLDLRLPAAVVVLHGAASLVADQLLGICPASAVVTDPLHSLQPRDRLAVVRTGGGLPLRTGSVAAFATAASANVLLEEAARILRPGGRLLAPARANIPAGLTELARDAKEWVAGRDASLTGVQLTRR